jgi:myosin heavy subunit
MPQLCDGASAEERARWLIRPAREFAYLNQSTCFDIPGESNAEEYKVRQPGTARCTSVAPQQQQRAHA